ncbi:unnamed protein product [Timema podura]|uniref:Uncharacterized protein n=1 Tax=Timema podura TaxID=61482 RepID=A0ABN7P714_TIMPD|nr:unnamed protein product [Timema podura]
MDSLQVAQSESSKSSSRSTSPCRPFAGSHSSHHLTTTTTNTTAVVTSAPHTPHITAPQNVAIAHLKGVFEITLPLFGIDHSAAGLWSGTLSMQPVLALYDSNARGVSVHVAREYSRHE